MYTIGRDAAIYTGNVDFIWQKRVFFTFYRLHHRRINLSTYLLFYYYVLVLAVIHLAYAYCTAPMFLHLVCNRRTRNVL